ncbi:MAG: TRAP transporter substrate-binding protein DctP, partial [Candidatus Eremiobacteraeota bacterium]|nr:TRAP transporter substrate-binding protein DctP [Candidatus Eremiobacteraeota bacterium]
MRSTRSAFAAGAAAAFASIALPSKPASAATFTWKWSFDLGAEHPISVRMVEAFGKIRKETKGQVDIKAFPLNVLGGIANVMAQTRSGSIEMSMQPGAIFDSIVPIAAIENLAYAYPNRKSALAALDGEVGGAIRKASLEKGMFLLDKIFENGWRDFTSSKAPIRTAVDLEGLRL